MLLTKGKATGLEQTQRWYKDAVIYQLHVKTFYDSDGDGIGDFRGLTEKLPYLQQLGVSAVWLLPFYPSPLKDDGYDISDFRGINPAYGQMRDFREFLSKAHQLGLRVITELVINHTSDQHPWFQRARHAKPGSAWRDFYVWSDTPDKYADARIIFKDFEASNWTYDPVAKAYYWHRFYSHQPDLNYENPKVHEAVFRALDFWLEMGVDGMRLDAIPYLYEKEGTNCENLPETHAFLRKLRARMDARYTDRMFLGEANQWPEDAVQYFGNCDECHMSFHFPLMPRLFMALYMEDRFPVIDILNQTPPIPQDCQWAIFLRNHDELTLEMVTDEERDYMYRVYARDPRMRLNLGIRRRLAPLLGNHRRRIELMNGLLFSLPGTPVIYYGDEIGMGDNIFLGDRNGVRTPMQWSSDRNAGFSRVNPQQLYLPVIIDPEYHFEVFNVEAQNKNRHSLLWWMRRIISLRNRTQAFSRGSLTFLEPDNPKVLAFIRQYEEQCILVVVNFSRYIQFAELDLSAFQGREPVELFGNTHFPEITQAPYFFTMGPHSFYWFNLQPRQVDQAAAAAPEELPVLNLKRRWEEIFETRALNLLARRLPGFCRLQRWFGAKGRSIKNADIPEILFPPHGAPRTFIAFAHIEYVDGSDETYILPLAFMREDEAKPILDENPSAALMRVWIQAENESGFLVDALLRLDFRRSLLKQLEHRSLVKGRLGRMVSWSGRNFRALLNHDRAALEETEIIGAEQSNTSVLYGGKAILKLFRRLQEGINPDLEISQFLKERDFQHMPPLYGALEYQSTGEEPKTLGILQGFVPNEGDAWTYTLESLYRYFERVVTDTAKVPAQIPQHSLLQLAGMPLPAEAQAAIGGLYLESVRLLARRTAQMHAALSTGTENPAFAPEPVSKLYQRSLYQSMRSLTETVFAQITRQLRYQSPEIRAVCQRILDRKLEILDVISPLLTNKLTGKRLRCHGDFHLGQVLYTGNDFVIIDFEGEPARPIGERRIKRSALRDIAGMLRSFHYAAYSAMSREEKRGLFHPEDRPFVDSWARYWYLWVGSAFMKEYLAETPPGAYLPDTAREMDILLNALLMEKAVYELGYELNNRPDWIKIPLEGIEDLLRLQKL